jgi:hypothetical protein
VLHQSFHLRFSNLEEIERACKEDEERRAVRTFDWISGRVARKGAKWVESEERELEMGKVSAQVGSGNRDGSRTSGLGRSLDSVPASTPWWDELRMCVEGEITPNRVEGWNHPMAGMSHSMISLQLRGLMA